MSDLLALLDEKRLAFARQPEAAAAIRELRAALEPFALVACHLSPTTTTDDTVVGVSHITAKQFRRARKALEGGADVEGERT